jgi:hypothetical protein
MNTLIECCITEIRNKSEKNGVEGYDIQTPKNPSIIVNYNLDNKTVDSYYDFLEQLWPSVYTNIPRAGKKSDFEEIENQVRSNQLYLIFNEIQIHVLVNITECDIEELNNFLNEKFNGPLYKIILHEFLDYERKNQIAVSEDNLLRAMKNRDKIRYQFVYSNRLFNGAMWLGENALKIVRLAANITAIMSIDSHYFNDNNAYTFSYNLLEKPTKKIVQFTIRRLLENACNCPENEKLDQEISKKYCGSVQKESSYRMGPLLVKESDFKYLPDNKKLQNEKANIKKNVVSLERNYPIAAMCFAAMIRQKVDNIQMKKVDFSGELSGPLLTYYAVEGFLKGNRQKKDLLESLERALLHDRQISDEGAYSKVLTEYANQAVEAEITERLFAIFSLQFMEKINHACDVYDWLRESLVSPELQINAIENEENLIGYYGKQVDDYFASHRDAIVDELNSCTDKEDLIENRLYSILLQMFDSIPIYYKSFEDEIDERVGNDTAKNMFGKLSEEDSVIRNICIDWTNLQFALNRVKTSDVLLLINPKSKLLKLKIADNYESLKLSRQDCVERIDFHTLSLKTEVN